MKKIIVVATTILLSSAPAFADRTLHSDDGITEWTIHSTGVDINPMSDGRPQVFAISTIKNKVGNRTEVKRIALAVSGCENGSGRISEINTDTGKLVGKQYVWINGGATMYDGAAGAACKEAIAAYQKKNEEGATNAPAGRSRNNF